jgi:hypothetical protein
MNQENHLRRKAVYAAIAVPLLFAIAWLSPPRTSQSSGGKLAQLRTEYSLGQTSLGKVDPASETIKLSTLGMQGFAAMILWHQANELKDTENWGALEAKLNQIAAIMPNFVGVWRFQAWNISYNVSVEFDDYRHRYIWVKKGIDYLKEGERYNKHEPRILSDLGWFHCHKIGQSDDRVNYRRMFFDEFHRDNWLVGKDWHLAAQQLTDRENLPVRGMHGAVFHSQPAMAQIHYAMAIEQDGLQIDDRAAPTVAERRRIVEQTLDKWQGGWKDAADDWNTGPNPLAEREFPIQQGILVRLGQLDAETKHYDATCRQLYEVAPKQADELLEKNRQHLADESRQILYRDADLRSEADRARLGSAIERLGLTYEFADQTADQRRVEARRLADETVVAGAKVEQIAYLREILNYDHWQARCQTEQVRAALEARLHADQARRARERGRLVPAKKQYEQVVALWGKLLEEHSEMYDDPSLGDDLVEISKEYRNLLIDDLGESFPKDFPLWEIIRQYDYDQVFPPDEIPPEGSSSKDAVNDDTVNKDTVNKDAASDAAASESASPKESDGPTPDAAP